MAHAGPMTTKERIIAILTQICVARPDERAVLVDKLLGFK
jgi:hypothetical protein